MTDDPVGTVVPVDLVAFCVGTTDAASRTAALRGATVDYSALTEDNPNAYLGGSATRGFDNEALQALESGVHLHWALPDALTRGVSDETTALAFPAVPNRWLVTRFVVVDGVATATSFVVESDTLSVTAPSLASLPVPVKSDNLQPDFHYLGLSSGLEAYDGTRADGARSLREATGFELTALANGLPSFAAYYPEGRNSFGFLDTLDHVATPAQLMYVVTGWFDNPTNDPASLAGADGTRRPLAESHGWVADAEGEYTLYSGVINGVSWDPGRSYVLPAEEQPTIPVEAAIANNPSEALAAYFCKALQLDPTSAHSERLLTAFQQGLWPRFTQSSTDALAQIAETLHDHQFRKIDSGLIYSIYLTNAGGEPKQEAIGLPGPIADSLNTLNAAAEDLLEVANHVETFQWRAFADWYRWFMTPEAQQPQIFSHFDEAIFPLWSPLQQALSTASAARDTALSGLKTLLALRPDLCLREEPGPRYWQPNEPALLLRSDSLAMPMRYGGDGAYRADGKLACRNPADLVTKVAIGSASRTAADFADAARLTNNNLPFLADCSALLAEACLLNPDLASAWSRVDPATLATALEDLLTGTSQNQWTIPAGGGSAPSPVEVNFWGPDNPWLPIFLTWTAQLTPLPATATEPYDPDFFTSNFAVDPTQGSFVSYTGPTGGAGPSSGTPAPPPYAGTSILSRKAAENFYGQIETYLDSHEDSTLSAIAACLKPGSVDSTFMVQPLSGFTEAMLNRELQMQFAMILTKGVHDDDAIRLTKAASGIVGAGRSDPGGPVTYSVGPIFDQPFNPIRAGAFSVALSAVDAFGQQRSITLNSVATAESMTSAATPGAAYAAPRLAQPSRLLFQWLSASTGNAAEYNGHPASSPICGWLLPNHLAGGFFLYDSDGRPLGSLFVAGDDVVGETAVIWQGAPGDDADIDQPIEQALAAANPQLRDLALHLKAGPVDDFQAFYQAVDHAHGFINPANLATDAGLAIFVGRPVALAQAALRLDLKGRPYLSQNGDCLESAGWVDTDAGLAEVTFPVVLGDIDRLDDGLIGYYLGTGSTYDLSTFFTEAAPADATGPVVQPDATTLLLKPTPALGEPDPPPAAADGRPLLMLIDPRAPVHAVTGILPTQSLLVPPDLASNALSTLQFSFLAAPVLQAAHGLALPVPRENGYDVSFLQQRFGTSGTREWFAQPDIGPSVAAAISNYSPQTLVEGWLRLNPTLLSAALVNGSGQPLAKGGATQAMTLSLVNRKPAPLTFKPGQPVPEGSPAKGSIFYIHFGALVAAADVAALSLASPDWIFTRESDDVYGTYFAATATKDVVLESAPAGSDPPENSRIDIAVTNLKAATGLVQAHLFVDYYGVGGASDGVATASVTVA